MANRNRVNRDGFTLMEIVIAVAIVAIFAAAISPMVFKHHNPAPVLCHFPFSMPTGSVKPASSQR